MNNLNQQPRSKITVFGAERCPLDCPCDLHIDLHFLSPPFCRKRSTTAGYGESKPKWVVLWTFRVLWWYGDLLHVHVLPLRSGRQERRRRRKGLHDVLLPLACCWSGSWRWMLHFRKRQIWHSRASQSARIWLQWLLCGLLVHMLCHCPRCARNQSPRRWFDCDCATKTCTCVCYGNVFGGHKDCPALVINDYRGKEGK